MPRRADVFLTVCIFALHVSGQLTVNLRSLFRIRSKTTARYVYRLFASVQPKGQLAVDAINSYQSVVSLLNTSTLMASAANRKIQDTMSFLTSVDLLEAAVNQSTAAGRALQQTIDQLTSSFAASGR